MGSTVALLLTVLLGYTLPEGSPLPTPDAATRARIDAALKGVRGTDAEETSRAVRDLALIGEPALPLVVKRLNEAEAGERLLLLAAVSRVSRAAPLLDQAKEDPHPAVRAWVATPERLPDPPLRELASRYLDILSIAERNARTKAGRDLDGLTPELGRKPDTFQDVRERLLDQKLAARIRAERQDAAHAFADAGARALQSGGLKPRLDDPVFVAFLALLREESWSFNTTAEALVRLGPAVEPVLESLLRKESYEPRLLVNLLRCVSADGGRGLFDPARSNHRPEVWQILIPLAVEILGSDDARELARRMVHYPDHSLWTAALDLLLEYPAPEGRDLARSFLDASRYGEAEFRRAAELLARAGDPEDLQLLGELAALVIPSDDQMKAGRMRLLKRSARRALRAHAGPETEPLAKPFLASADPGLRNLGVDLTSDPALLDQYLQEEADTGLAGYALRRLVALDEALGVAAAIRLVRATKSANKRFYLVRPSRSAAIYVRLLEEDDPKLHRLVLTQLARFETLDPRFEEALLAFYDLSEGEMRGLALAALLALGGEEVGRRVREAGDDATDAMVRRARGGTRVRHEVKLLRRMPGAGPAEWDDIERLAQASPSTESGIYFALLMAWEESFKKGIANAGDLNPRDIRIRLIDALARSKDTKSARSFWRWMLKTDPKELSLILGACRVAARLLPSEEVDAVLPRLRAAAKAEHPVAEKLAPPQNIPRQFLISGGMHALAWTQSDAGLAFLCELILDPQLQPAAFEEGSGTAIWFWAFHALRRYPAAKVHAALKAELSKAEKSGALARLEPGHLLDMVQECRRRRYLGRGLNEVALLLVGVLERLPFDGDVSYERMVAESNLGRYAAATQTARARRAERAQLGFRDDEGYWSGKRMERRAKLFEALAARDPELFRAAVDEAWNDPLVLWLAGRYLLLNKLDLDLAARACERAVQLTGRNAHLQRDALAGVRLAQNRPDAALDLLDLDGHLPVRRSRTGTGWHLFYEADARMLKGDRSGAAFALESALVRDRRLLPRARKHPRLKDLAEAFSAAEEEYFDRVFSLRDG